jgi:hypothetical protein
MHSALIIWWSCIIALMLIFAFFPVLIDVIGKLFRISYPPIIISIVGIGLVFVKILSMDIYITRNEARFIELAQKMAVLERLYRDQDKSSP